MHVTRRRLLAIWLLALLPVATGCGAGREFSFIVTADSRGFTPPEHPGPEYFTGVCEAVREVGKGEFMLSPGDIDPPDRTWQTIVDVLGPDYPWYPVVGNHELDKPEFMPWLREFNAGGKQLPNVVRGGPPGAVETCYAFDHGNAHFIVINQYYDGEKDNVKGGDVGDALYAWLAEALAANDKPIIFVAGHEPHLSAPDMDNGRVRHRGDSLDAHEENNHRFWSLLREHNVTAYFCGHTHCTSVVRVNGVWQLDAGHARGKGDRGAMSSFFKIRVAADGSVFCDVYRCADPGTEPYRLTFTERLR